MLPISREQAINLLNSMPQEGSDMNHYLETEAIMRALAEYFNEDLEYWGMLGLLHDVDWSTTKNDWSKHTIHAEEILKSNGFDKEFIEIVQSHAYGMELIPAHNGKQRNKRIEHALVAAETVTGVIYAYALMRNKNISTMDASGLKKRFKDKSFARNCNRELVKEIEKTGLELTKFFELSIEALKSIKQDIGLE